MSPDKNTIVPASRMQELPDYLFGKLNAEKQRLRSEGKDIIDFGMGNPDMPASREAVEKMRSMGQRDAKARLEELDQAKASS